MSFKPKSTLSRRGMLMGTGTAATCLSVFNPISNLWKAKAQSSRNLEVLNRFPRAVHSFYSDHLDHFDFSNDEAWMKLQNHEQAEAFVQNRRNKIKKVFGPFPEKTDLNPRITGILERPDYQVEKILFESRPDFLVTANLWIPKGFDEPLPGVVGVCGHSDTGKAAEPYQAFAQGLCRLGFAVLMIDPIGQGERLQAALPDGRSQFGVGVREHLQAGNQQFLVDEFLGMWRAWDGIRALDYLISRPEIDSTRVGVTGNSGGGTMTTWLCGLEDRWSMGAPSCFVTSFAANFRNELPADTEQCPPDTLAMGLDHVDYLAAMAPKPLILLTKEKDYFDVRGSEEAFSKLKRLYGLLGAEDRVSLFTGPTGHGYSVENREAMYAWFTRWGSLPQSKIEPALTYENPEDLNVTQAGQVSLLGSKTIFDFTRNAAIRMKASRPVPDVKILRGALGRYLNFNAQTKPEYRILRPLSDRDHPVGRTTVYMVESESGIEVPVYLLTKDQHLSRPQATHETALLYVSHQSCDEELRSENWLRQKLGELVQTAIFAMDVRGVGETRPNTCGGSDTFLQPYGNDYFYAIHGLMMGYPYPLQKTRDVLAALAFIRNAGFSKIHLIAHQWGAIPATFAAVMDNQLESVHLHKALSSYQDVAMTRDYRWPLSTFLKGVLKSFDLPDCYRCIAEQTALTMTETLNARGNPA